MSLTAVRPPNLRVSPSVRNTGVSVPTPTFAAGAGVSMPECVDTYVEANLQAGGKKVLSPGIVSMMRCLPSLMSKMT